MTPKVSVLIPVQNAESTVGPALESILRQTFDDFEVVAVDDGATDTSGKLLDDAARRDRRVRVIHTPNQGIIHALNAGLSICSGELVARMDADDISARSRLAQQVRMMDQNPEISVCSSLVRVFPRKNLLGGLVRYEQWLNSLVTPDEIRRDIFVESPIAHPSAVVRRSELIDLGGYQEHGWPEDYDLWLRYHEAGKRFAKAEKRLFFWRQSETRLTFTDSRYSVENFLRAKAHYLARMLRGVNRPIVLWGAGKTGRRILKHLLREGLEVEAVIDIDYKKIGRTLRRRPIVSHNYLMECPTAFVIAAVGSHAARRLIRQALQKHGFTESEDFICAA